MWIHHIGEIAIGFFILLIVAHFGLHLLFKWQKRKQKAAQEQASKEISTTETDADNK